MDVSHGCWLEASVPHHENLSSGLLEYPHDMAAGFPQSKWSQKEQDESHNVFYGLALEVTYHHFFHFLLVTQPILIHYERGLYKDINT